MEYEVCTCTLYDVTQCEVMYTVHTYMYMCIHLPRNYLAALVKDTCLY